MAIIYDGPMLPDALTAFVREVPIPTSNALSLLFPSKTFTSNRVDWAELTKTNRTAQYRSFDGTIHVSQRDAGTGKYGELAPFSDSLNKGEYERVAQEVALLSGTNKAPLVAAAYNDAERLVGTMHNRIELAWGDVLSDGKLTINEGGLQAEADYGVPATQITAPAGALWSDHAASVPLTDLEAQQQVRLTNGNGKAAGMLVSRAVLSHMRTNKEIIDAIYGSTQGRTRVGIGELNTLLASEELPTVASYDSSFNVDGTVTRTIAPDKAILLPENAADLGFMAYGLSATALELINSSEAEMAFEDGPGIVGVVEKVGPPYREFTFVDAVGMPILTNAGLLSVLDVA